MRDRSSIANPGYVGLEGMPRDNSDTEFLGILVPQLCIEARSIADIDALLGPNGAEGPVEGADPVAVPLTTATMSARRLSHPSALAHH
jgi:hypothetical protein